MKYSTFILVVISIAVLCTSLCGCNRNKGFEPYTVLEIGTEEAEAAWRVKDRHDYTAPAGKSVTINGKTYTGSYGTTTVAIPNRYTILDWYFTEDSKYNFKIDHNTGKLVYFSAKETTIEPDCSLNDTYCRQLADSVAEEYINISQYTVKKTGAHEYKYYREIDGYSSIGYKPIDDVTIKIGCNGEVEVIDANMAGAFDDVKSVNIDKEKVESAIEKKVNQICQERMPNQTMTRYDTMYGYLMKTENNQCALYYSVFAYFGEQEQTYLDFSLLVIVDYE